MYHSLIQGRLAALALLLALIAAPLSLVGCNTTAGVGEDLEAAGEAIEGKAEKEKRY